MRLVYPDPSCFLVQGIAAVAVAGYRLLLTISGFGIQSIFRISRSIEPDRRSQDYWHGLSFLIGCIMFLFTILSF